MEGPFIIERERTPCTTWYHVLDERIKGRDGMPSMYFNKVSKHKSQEAAEKKMIKLYKKEGLSIPVPDGERPDSD